MKALWILAVGGLAAAAYVHLAYPDYSHRYRLTIEVETPEGVKSGSSVLQVMRTDQRYLPMPGYRVHVGAKGDAVFVDLGQGRNLVALLAHGPRAEYLDQIATLALAAFDLPGSDVRSWASIGERREQVLLRSELIPTLIGFTDLSDPKTARLVQEHQFETAFGPGVRFRRAWIEMTRDPVTRGIEKQLPWWNATGRPAYQAHLAMKGGDRTGPSSGAEYLFVRK